jgi:hypothetical protein
LLDIVSASGGNAYVKLWNGWGFNTGTWSIQNTWGGSGYTKVGDFDGDGRTDILSASGNNLYMKWSTGAGFTHNTFSHGNIGWGDAAYTYVGEFTGTSKSDIASFTGGSGLMSYDMTFTGGFTNQNWTTSNLWGQSEYTGVGYFKLNGKMSVATAVGCTIYLHTPQPPAQKKFIVIPS